MSWKAIGIAGPDGFARSSGTLTVPHFALAAAPAPHFPNTALGAAAAALGSVSAAMAAKDPRTALRPDMAARYCSAPRAAGVTG
ncbi:hypothetical protein [Candidatus Solirubrobacter pratensis]|uniref:hypothetical protein n=1 Tax=Candidatus Solirubrobacter pratensis TaxID=1298857 RepID=UPI000404093C|nr:hypothetical protein [Candidatus Solirubrobacter pratensis]